MNARLASLLSPLFLASLVAFTGCAAQTADDSGEDGEQIVDGEEDLTSGSSNFGYYVVTRRDVRKCAAPLCGGYFVKRVNQDTTTCADGKKQAECYVSAVQLTGIGLSEREEASLLSSLEEGKALVKAATYKKKSGSTAYGLLKASEGWVGATGSAPDGTFYRAAKNDIQCITAPCPTTTVYQLNGHDDHNVIDVNLSSTASPADQASLDLASQALATKQGVLIAGSVALPKCMPSPGCGPVAIATEFYLRVTPREGKACGSKGLGGCNADQFCQYAPKAICGAADAPGVCAYRPQACPQLYQPVCGCDGKTYGNACSAASYGVSVSSDGACAK